MYNQSYNQLLDIIKPYQRLCVSYSGGVDSTFLAKAAIDALGKENVLCVLIKGYALPAREYANAIRYADAIGAELAVLDVDEFAVEQFGGNTTDRCYHCKKFIFSHIFKFMKSKGYDILACGSNVDDLSDYRPGNRAVEEAGVKCPLIEADFDKEKIRQLSRELGLESGDNPSSPCLASRVPYGRSITPQMLKQIDKAESYLYDMGMSPLRVRHYGDTAKIEVPCEYMEKAVAMSEKIVSAFKDIGFTYITLDLEGFRSGAMNEVL
ncbi:MAG: ATP-dependent sacrificial sulfur transferase LarE [Sedimentisphaeraceae bacterium JB056]